MYGNEELTDIQRRLAKGWVIRRDELEMLLKMAWELARMKEGAKAPIQPGAWTVVPVTPGWDRP